MFNISGFKKKNNEKLVDLNQVDLDDFYRNLIKRVSPYTMTSVERIISLVDAVRYLDRFEIQGSFVECGVWKGGSAMAMLEASKMAEKAIDRQLYLYDTFEGMTDPGEEDVSVMGKKASEHLEEEDKKSSVVWAYSPLEEVEKNVKSVSHSSIAVNFIKGPVEETLLDQVPEKIALLRLDTDWYESTKVELEVLFPKLVQGGILIIDDYGHWQGCKQAVDEYFSNYDQPVFLNRIDYTGRLLVKN